LDWLTQSDEEIINLDNLTYAGTFKKMWVILLEIGVAVTLFFIIIWWTLPRKKNNKKKD